MAKEVVNIDVQVNTKSIGELESELAKVNDELKQVEIGSDAFNTLTKQSQKLNGELNKVNQRVEGLTLEKKVRAAQGAVTALAGGLEASVGTLGLLGVESEVFGKFEEKAISALTAARGFIDISDGIGQMYENLDIASVKAKIFGITTKQAIIATGVGALVVLVGTLVAYWDDVTKAVDGFAKKVPFVGKAIDTVKGAINGLIDAFRPVLEFLGILPDEVERANAAAIETNEEIISQGERELALLQARGATAEELFAKKEEMLKAELDNLKRNGAEAEEIYKKETELLVAQEAEKKRIADEDQKRRDEAAAKRKAEADKKAEEAKQQKEKDEQDEKDRLQSIEDIRKEYQKRAEDDAAETEEQKLLLEQERKLKELEDLEASEEAKLEIIKYYQDRIKEVQDEEAEAARVKKEEEDAADLEKQKQLEQEKLNLKKDSLQTLSELFGQETALGKAALLAKQAILVQELIQNAKSTLGLATKTATDATLKGADSAASIAQGTANTAKVGFPQNIPLLIGYAAQAAGIISAVKSAVSTAKQTATTAGAPGGGGVNFGQTRPSISVGSIPSDTPAPQVVAPQPAIKAYVISGDVSNSQEAEARLNRRRSLG